MSEAVQVALIVAVGSVVTTMITHWRAARKLEHVATSTHGKLDHITVLTNSNLANALKRNDELEKLIMASGARVEELEALVRLMVADKQSAEKQKN